MNNPNENLKYVIWRTKDKMFSLHCNGEFTAEYKTYEEAVKEGERNSL